MAAQFLVFVITVITLSQIPSASSSPGHGLSQGSCLSFENKNNILVSLNGLFSAGFHQVGDNAYCFAVWFSESRTVVWMANRDEPIDGKHSKLSLRKDGNLVLTDAYQQIIWSTGTKSMSSSVQLQLNNAGNLVLRERERPLWQSFDYPTDILLPNQLFTKNTELVSSRSSTNYSSGFYKLFFDYESIIRLRYDGLEKTSVFWPDPGLRTWEAGRSRYMYSQRAILDSQGQFNSSDGFIFKSADFGTGPQRIMKVDIDGNIRVYSLVEHQRQKKWEVQWQAISRSCKVHGICGANSLCTYSQDSGRGCTCLHGYKMVNSEDWSYGCEPEFQMCEQDDYDFIELRFTEFYGFDIRFHKNYTLDACKKDCLQDCTCKGFQFGCGVGQERYYSCFIKTSLYNGYQMGVNNSMYVKLPKRLITSFHQKATKESGVRCLGPALKPIRTYEEKNDSKPLSLMLVFGCVIGFIEIFCIVFFWYSSSKCSAVTQQIYFPAATGFRKFTYHELKKASRNFSEEIGRGGASVVYKDRLSDNRLAAIKRLRNINHHGEDEFQAEISTIGRLNHMNLIETWGYCAEGKHRLVVYEYMENGSLAENLRLGKLDWNTRFDIAMGTAKGLAYLHEECLEWVLHCDVKSHNILLDANYNPKVADFGLSKLFNRDGILKWNFSMIRGTRGYMAPEWVFNLPITSKVDVFSYGVVVLEMITGRSPAGMKQASNENGETQPVLIDWVRDRVQEFDETESWVEEIIDPSTRGEYDRATMENLVRIALQCVQEDRKARPSMGQVVNMLLHQENDSMVTNEV